MNAASGEPAPDTSLAMFVSRAMQARASSLHFEYDDCGMIVAMRVRDGLRELARLSAGQMAALLSQLRQAAPLTSEGGSSPRKGSGSCLIDGNRIDFSLSLLPMAMRDRMVLKFDSAQRHDEHPTLAGLAGKPAQLLGEALGEASGLILIVGNDAGYAQASLATCAAHFVGARAPIFSVGCSHHQPMPGVMRVQHLPEDNMGFRACVEAVLNQEPDVLMIDSIEDPAIAKLAIRASLNGALVLSSLNAVSTVDAFSRLRSLKHDPFELASSLRAIIAQRPVRQLCSFCRIPEQTSQNQAALLGFDTGVITYQPAGCARCDGEGFDGHSLVFEVLRVDHDLRQLINKGCDEAILARQAFLYAPTLGASARALARQGIITAEEAIRISRGSSD